MPYHAHPDALWDIGDAPQVRADTVLDYELPNPIGFIWPKRPRIRVPCGRRPLRDASCVSDASESDLTAE